MPGAGAGLSLNLDCEVRLVRNNNFQTMLISRNRSVGENSIIQLQK